MKRISTLENSCRIETYDLTEEQHDLAVDMVKNNKRVGGTYTLEEVDADTLEYWIDDVAKEAETDEERRDYFNFLTEAQLCDCDIYTLTDHLGEFSQPIGEVAVYDC